MDNQEIIPESWFDDVTVKTLVEDNPLPVPQHFTSAQYSKEVIAKSIFFYSIKNQHGKVVFAGYPEGLNAINMFTADDIVKICIEKYKMSPNKFVFLNGCFANQANLNFYKEHCKNYNLIEMDIRFLNTYEYMSKVDADLKNDLINKEPLGFPTKEKPFLCFNGVARTHRVLLIGEIFARNLHPYTFLSCYDKNFISQVVDARCVLDHKVYGDRYYKLFFEIMSRQELFPMQLTQPGGQICTHDYSLEDHELYKKSYISVVTETDFFQKYMGYRTISLNCTFPTEKTFKPIKARHPFIIISRPHFLKHLKEQGYKTFHPHINESYDDIENDERRLNAIMSEMERLSKYSEQEWGNFLYHTNHICQHNYDRLRMTEKLKAQVIK